MRRWPVLVLGILSCTQESVLPAKPAPQIQPTEPVARPGRPDLTPRKHKVGSDAWEPVATSLATPRTSLALPNVLDQVEGIGRKPDAASEALLVNQGFYLDPEESISAVAKFYTAMTADGNTVMVPFDVLFYFASLAVTQAIQESSRVLVDPSVPAFLKSVGTFLDKDAKAMPPDLVRASAQIRVVVSVARALVHETFAVASDVAPIVEAELKNIREASGVLLSPALGLEIDYTRFSPTYMSSAWSSIALTWLSHAPLLLSPRSERKHSHVTAGAARESMKAALLLFRATRANGNARDAFEKIDAWKEVVYGESDDISLELVGEVSTRLKIDDSDPRSVGNAASIEKLRHTLLEGSETRARDLATPVRTPVDPSSSRSFRVFPPSASEDVLVLSQLTYPGLAKEERGAPESRKRTFPSGLDIVYWMNPELRPSTQEEPHDPTPEYDKAFLALVANKPAQGAESRHVSIVASLLDTIETYANPSAADYTQGLTARRPWQIRKIEACASSWALLRNALNVPRTNSEPQKIDDLRLSPSATVFVDPHPEAIAKLLASVRQTGRILTRLGGIRQGGPASISLNHAETILSTALGLSVQETNDEALAEGIGLIRQMELLERHVGQDGDPRVVARVHSDLQTGKSMHIATGAPQHMRAILRLPGSERFVLAHGLSIPYVEFNQATREPLTNTTWQHRVELPAGPPLFLKTRPKAPSRPLPDSAP